MSNWAGVAQIDHLDQETLEGLARTCTRPRKGVRYKDPQSVKALFKAARVSGSAPAWKAALKARTAARKKWEYERLVRAAEGDWQTFKELRPTKHEGWDVHFAEVQSEDPQSTWLLSMREGRLHRTFEEAELKSALSGLRRGRAVGIDHTSAELLFGGCGFAGGLSHLLEWYNRVLTTQVIPKQWNKTGPSATTQAARPYGPEGPAAHRFRIGGKQGLLQDAHGQDSERGSSEDAGAVCSPRSSDRRLPLHSLEVDGIV